MLTRRYSCPVIGRGTDDDPYRPVVADMGVGWTADIVTGEYGRPTQARCIVEVTAADHSALLADSEIEVVQ